MDEFNTTDPSRELFIAKIKEDRVKCTQRMLAAGVELMGKCTTDAQRAEVRATIEELRELL